MVHTQITTLNAGMNIFEVMKLFRTEQCHMEASFLQLAAGGTVRSKEPSRKRKKERIKRLEEKFDAGDYTLVEYLSAVSRLVGF